MRGRQRKEAATRALRRAVVLLEVPARVAAATDADIFEHIDQERADG
jgi:hypothetical protein